MMKNKNMNWGLVGVLFASVLFACDPPPPPICIRLCDQLYFAEEDYAESECSGLDTPMPEVLRECRQSCTDSWHDTTDADKEDAHACLDCILERTPNKPTWEEVEDAITGGCQSKCTDADDFNDAWDTFYYQWHLGIDYNDRSCPPKYSPDGMELDAGEDSDTGDTATQ
jgi:hypothetical protein